MAVTMQTPLKTARITATRDHFAGGTIEILAGATVLATFTLSASGGTVSGLVWTNTFGAGSTATQAVTASAGGTADGARYKTSGGVANGTGLTVGVGSGDVQLNTLTIGSGATVTCTGATWTHG